MKPQRLTEIDAHQAAAIYVQPVSTQKQSPEFGSATIPGAATRVRVR